jgi:uncharacterized protein (DUF885 family)
MLFIPRFLLRRSTSIIFLALFLAAASFAHGKELKTLDDHRKELKQLLADEWEYEMRESPESATALGDYRYNDRWSDNSLAHIQQQKDDVAKWLARFNAIDVSGFPEQEKLNQSLMVRNLKETLEGMELKTYEMPINQFFGAHLQLAQFVALVPLDSTKHYEDYLARLHKLPQLVSELIEILQQGEKDKLLPPRFLLEKAVTQCKSIADPEGEANAFGQPAAKIPDAVPPADRKRLHDAIITAVNTEVRPAYNKLADFLAKEYAPKGRTEPGVWALPNGNALYRFAVRQSTTTNMDPEAIHQLGLKEVARIEAEQLSIAKKLGFADLKTFRASLKTNPSLNPKSPDQLVEAYKGYISQMEPELPKLFGLLPKTRVEIRPMQTFREKEAAGADYQQGTPDGSRPGVVYVNTSDYQNRTLTSPNPSGPTDIPPAGWIYRLCGRLGVIRREAWQGYWFLQRPLFILRALVRRNVASCAPGARYRRALQALDAAADD